MRPNYFIFIGYLKTWRREGGSSDPLPLPLNPLWIRHYNGTYFKYCTLVITEILMLKRSIQQDYISNIKLQANCRYWYRYAVYMKEILSHRYWSDQVISFDSLKCHLVIHAKPYNYIGLDARKPVFRDSDKVNSNQSAQVQRLVVLSFIH